MLLILLIYAIDREVFGSLMEQLMINCGESELEVSLFDVNVDVKNVDVVLLLKPLLKTWEWVVDKTVATGESLYRHVIREKGRVGGVGIFPPLCEP